jgi:chromosome segregation protein
MFLKELEITGFKSFARPVRLELEPGITAVVGPNGSGKSNIVDAVRWVLGEQSARALRGAKGEDVIFGGSDTRHALGMAEVTLVLDNADGRVGLDVAEVALARRLYRSGETEYLLNRRRARLRDVLDAAGQAGLGPDSYCVVGQGTIEQLVLQRPQERRSLIADAADVRRHEARLAEIESDLTQTQQTALRMSAAATEIRPQLERLRAQAERADRHHRVRDETARLARAWFSRALPAARIALDAAERRRAQLHANIASAGVRLAEVEGRRARLHEDIRVQRQRAREVEAHLGPARRALENMRVDRAATGERLASSARRLEELRGERERIGSDLVGGRAALTRSAAALHEAQAAATDAAAAQAATKAATARVAAARGELQEARGRIEKLEREAARLAARLERPPLSPEFHAAAQGSDGKLDQIVLELGECQRALTATHTEIAWIVQHAPAVRNELAELQAILSGIGDRLARAVGALGEVIGGGKGRNEPPAQEGKKQVALPELLPELEVQLAAIRDTIETQRKAIDAAERVLQEAMEAQAALSAGGAVARERLARLTETHDRDAQDVGRLERRSANIDLEITRLQDASAEVVRRQAGVTDGLATHEAAVSTLEQAMAEAAAAVAAEEAAAENVDAEFLKAQTALADARTQEAAAGTDAEHARAAVDHLEMELSAAAESLVVDQADLLRADVASADLAALDDPILHSRLERAQRELRSLGSVDYAVLAEFGTLRDRYAFLSEQLEDLAKAEAEIRDGMAQVREQIQQQFATAFADVNERFKERFRELFSGGDAELVLAGDADNAQSGVDIVAQPPGKRLHRIATLSGGERALTGAALLLGLIGANPSPFCILDEVDAALDDANVQRFAGTIREMAAQTQFILVTHNRATMEMADALYGVTMTSGAVSQILSMRLE